MADPFKSLRTKREAEASKARLAEEARRQEEHSRAALMRRFGALVIQNQLMVQTVLEQLRDAEYPRGRIVLPDQRYLTGSGQDRTDQSPPSPTWEIRSPGVKLGIDNESVEEYFNSLGEPWVSVAIILDEQGRPLFSCVKGARQATCSLSEPELVNTLLQLHT